MEAPPIEIQPRMPIQTHPAMYIHNGMHVDA